MCWSFITLSSQLSEKLASIIGAYTISRTPEACNPADEVLAAYAMIRRQTARSGSPRLYSLSGTLPITRAPFAWDLCAQQQIRIRTMLNQLHPASAALMAPNSAGPTSSVPFTASSFLIMSALSRFWDQSFFIPKPSLTEQNLADQEGRVVLVTGGYAGVGYELSKILYHHNATVYVAGRDRAKGEKRIG